MKSGSGSVATPTHQEARYRATVVDSEQYLLTLMRYACANFAVGWCSKAI